MVPRMDAIHDPIKCANPAGARDGTFAEGNRVEKGASIDRTPRLMAIQFYAS